MVVYPMMHRVDRKILLDVINPWSRVDRNIPVSLWEEIHACVRKIGVPAPLNYMSTLSDSLLVRTLALRSVRSRAVTSNLDQGSTRYSAYVALRHHKIPVQLCIAKPRP